MRRLFWLGVGAVAGASGTVWAERKVRSRLDQLAPDHLVVSAGNKARDVGRSVVDAVVEGRGAMREREDELRRSYGTGPGSPSVRRGTHSATPTRPSTGTWSRGGPRHR
jgi:hypothetical protein